MKISVLAVAGLLVLGGCSAASQVSGVPSSPSAPFPAPTVSVTTAPSVSPSPPAASASEKPLQEIAITLAKGKADPNGERVSLAKGTTLVLTITADHADEVHVHGYDIEIPVKSGATVTREILLDQVGRFEVESHEPQLTILQLTVS